LEPRLIDIHSDRRRQVGTGRTATPAGEKEVRVNTDESMPEPRIRVVGEGSEHALDWQSSSQPIRSARGLIESTVVTRARHDTPDKVSDTRSFANMERTLT